MENKDSSTAISSLLSQYGDASDEEIINEAPGSAVDNISDEESENKREGNQLTKTEPMITDENSPSSLKIMDYSDTPTKPKLVKKATKLVSYGPDDHEEDKSSSEEEVEEEEEDEFEIKALDRSKGGSCLETEVASSLSRSVLYMPAEDIKLPPEPPGKCTKTLQDKISSLYEKMRRDGLNLNATIQRRKDFRNPSIYEKLIDFCGIDSHGSNFPAEIYNPYLWSKESYYDELDKVQKKEMEKREKDRKDKTKVEFVTGTKKTSGSVDSSDDKKRKTKWDTAPSASSTLTSSVTGTKSTVIPAVGNISKKSK
ncbi:SAP30-binding protein isoform X2 [Patella vulgata]|nr:SAP30-binding protein isoform X2 [Patella vulgata]